MNSCPKCGAARVASDIECPECGVIYAKVEMSPAQKAASRVLDSPQNKKQILPDEAKSDIKEKSLPAAIGLNLLLPGAGYFYMERYVLGLLALCLIGMMLFTMPLIFAFGAGLSMNLIMAIDMIILNNKRTKEAERMNSIKCPQCAELIKREAKVCRYCNTQLK